MRRSLFGVVTATALVAPLVLLGPVPANAQSVTKSVDALDQFWSQNYPLSDLWKETLNKYSYIVLAKAKPDECYYGLNDSRNDFEYPADLTKAQIKSCLNDDARLKTNQSYVWGLTKAGNNLWFGTAANNLCLLPESMFGGSLPAYETSAWACEAGGKDSRPPRMYVYDTSKNKLTDLTPQVVAKGGDDLSRLLNTIGIRSAGSANGVVFFGGITTDIISASVTMFAFNAATMKYIGSYAFDGSDLTHPRYSNIRQWVVASNELYVGVGTTVSLGLTSNTGKVLRWIGTTAEPFQFETVGELGADPAYLVEYKGRLVSSTWGDPEGPGFVLYMSPEFSSGKLTEADKDNWSIVWRMSEYEVEPAAIQSGGAIAVEGDALIWGSLVVPTTGILAYQYMYPTAPTDVTAIVAAFLGTYRPTTIFRGYNLEDPENRHVDVLYGSSILPKFNPSTNEWSLVPNGMGGQMPLMGPPGFGNFFNAYTWWMHNYHGQVFVGTFDFLYVAARIADPLLPEIPKDIKKLVQDFEGADLWVFANDTTPAFPVTLSGAGNIANFGIRTMATVKDTLYLGSANPMNLLTDGQVRGGWELIKVIPQNEQ